MAYSQPHGGAADAYYAEGQQQYQQPTYPPPIQQSQQQQYAPLQPQQPYPQQPPKYGGQPVQSNGNEKLGFEQTFKLEKPRYNDLWAAILFLLTFGGFVAVSGLAIHGYAAQGAGAIYDANSEVSLNSNTVILL
jgi:hypothetical protein